MGAWGIDAFENDAACDWAYGLEKVNDLSLIEETLNKVINVGGEYLDASEAEEALAAAETLAKLKGKGGKSDSYTEIVDNWIRQITIKPTSELIQKAIRSIDRMSSTPSELLELWEESDEFTDWKKSLNDLKNRLSS